MTTLVRPEPFWSRLRQIALYPLQGTALLSLVVYSTSSLLGFLPGIGWLLALVVWVAVYQYSFEILVRTANGWMDAPEIATYTDIDVVLRFVVLWLLFTAATLLTAHFAGVSVAMIVMLLLTFVLPGAIISLAIDGVLLHAINPATLFEIIRRIGAPYFVAFALLFVIQLAAENLGGLFARFMPLLFAHLLVMATALWGLFATFHLMGYLVFQYQDVFGFTPGANGTRPKLRNRDDALMESVQVQVAEGDIDASIARLHEEMRERAVPIASHELYRRLLRQRKDEAALVEHAGSYLNLLLLEKKGREALALLRETLMLRPDFTPHQAEDGDHLAQRARASGQVQLAIDIWLAMLKRWSRDPNRSEWAIACAQHLAQRDRLDLAREVLERCRHGLDDPARQVRIDAALAALPAG